MSVGTSQRVPVGVEHPPTVQSSATGQREDSEPEVFPLPGKTPTEPTKRSTKVRFHPILKRWIVYRLFGYNWHRVGQTHDTRQSAMAVAMLFATFDRQALLAVKESQDANKS